jgi:hypothetical protein
MIPKPLARVRITYGRPFEVAPGNGGLAEGLEEAALRLDEISRTNAWVEGAMAIG